MLKLTQSGILALALVCLGAPGCDQGEPADAARFTSTMNEPSTFDTDFVGEGGTVSEVFSWENPQPRAEYSMDITAGMEGRVDVILWDAEENEVASFALDDSSTDDTLDGISESGVPGTWTIEVTVSGFAGDGSLHVGSAEEARD